MPATRLSCLRRLVSLRITDSERSLNLPRSFRAIRGHLDKSSKIRFSAGFSSAESRWSGAPCSGVEQAGSSANEERDSVAPEGSAPLHRTWAKADRRLSSVPVDVWRHTGRPGRSNSTMYLLSAYFATSGMFPVRLVACSLALLLWPTTQVPGIWTAV